jgi:hypothetical protein
MLLLTQSETHGADNILVRPIRILRKAPALSVNAISRVQFSAAGQHCFIVERSVLSRLEVEYLTKGEHMIANESGRDSSGHANHSYISLKPRILKSLMVEVMQWVANDPPLASHRECPCFASGFVMCEWNVGINNGNSTTDEVDSM